MLIVTFGFQVARVEGMSMAPTLEDQDRLIVNKLIYRLSSPRKGDIVMLYYPVNPDKSFVKRVIAEEGDMVRIVDGHVFVNDVPLNDDYVPNEFRSHDDYGPQVIPEGYYFVMGDHRNNSSDSRHWGMVPKKYIIGKVQVRWWPLPEARRHEWLAATYGTRDAASPAASRSGRVDRLDERPPALLHHLPAHLHRRRQLPALHRELGRQQREPLDALELRQAPVQPVQHVLVEPQHLGVAHQFLARRGAQLHRREPRLELGEIGHEQRRRELAAARR